jgi:AcrR family transcriptional regulator
MRPRRTQAERSATTRAALLDATLACLVERGVAGTTTTEVAHRAGVSLGALGHHFPSKADLLTAAVRHLLERRQDEFRKAMADLDPGIDRMDAAIDLLWSMVSGPSFVAWLELTVAARTDPELAEAMRRTDAAFAESSVAIFRELFPEGEATGGLPAEIALGFTFALLEGLALACLLGNPPGLDPRSIVELHKAAARVAFPRPTEAAARDALPPSTALPPSAAPRQALRAEPTERAPGSPAPADPATRRTTTHRTARRRPRP